MGFKLSVFGRWRRRERQAVVARNDAPDVVPSLFALPGELDGFSLFTVRSSSGFVVYANVAGRLVTNRSHPNGAAGPVVGFRVKAQPGTLFLVTATSATPVIDLDSDLLRAPVISYTVSDSQEANRVTLRHPEHGGFVSAAPGGDDIEVDLSSNRSAPDFWELFELVPLNGRLSTRFSDLIAGVARAFGRDPGAEQLLRWVRAEAPQLLIDAGAAVLRVAAPENLGQLGLAALHEPAVFDLLQLMLPADPWTSDVLRQLCFWVANRSVSRRISVGKDLDFLAYQCAVQKASGSIGARLVTQTRRCIDPTRSLAVLATARNEGMYFLEFVAHYRALGAEHVFIYSNDNNDNSDELLAALADAGAITWINNSFDPHVDGQTKAYSHHLSCLPDGLDFEWTLVVDLDEFLVLDTDRFSSLPDLLQERRAAGANAVAMSWMVFTPSGRYRWEPAPLIERFDQREWEDNTAVKTAFVTRDAVSSFPHDPVFTPGVNVTYVGATGEPHWWPARDIPPSNGPPIYRNAWVNHYFFKSAEEFIWKASRNRGGFRIKETLRVEPEQLGDLANLVEATTPVDVQAQRHLPALQTSLAHLRSLPGVAEAEAKVIRTFRARVDQLLAEADRSLARAPDDAPFKPAVGRMLARVETLAREPTVVESEA